MTDIVVRPVRDFPVVDLGAKLGDLIGTHVSLLNGDIVVIASTAVSVAEQAPAPIEPNDGASLFALVESQSARVLRRSDHEMIAETSHGFIVANAGIDTSTQSSQAILLPRDSDRTAFKIRERLRAQFDVAVGVVVAAQFDRPWRAGATRVAVGSSGVRTLTNPGNGAPVCTVDELAAAAGLALAESPVAVIHGAPPDWLDDTNDDVRNSVIRPSADHRFR